MKKVRSLTMKIPGLFLVSVAVLLPYSACADVDAGYEAANNISGTCPTNANVQKARTLMNLPTIYIASCWYY